MRTFVQRLSLAAVCLLPFSLSIAAESPSAATFDDTVGPALRPALEVTEPTFRHPRPVHADLRSFVLHWNEVAINASGLDHTPVAAGESRVFGEQLGPGRSSRAMAITHIAMFDAANAIAGTHQSYTGVAASTKQTSMSAAIAQAAHDTLAALYPSQREALDALLADDLQHQTPGGQWKANGIELGARAAAAILALRSDDGAQHPESRIGVDYLPSSAAGHWRQDPIGLSPLALGARWGTVKPFVLASADQFRVPPPPAMTSAAYGAAFDEVKLLGGDGIV